MSLDRLYNGNIITFEEYNSPVGVPGGNSGNFLTQNMIVTVVM